MYRESSSYSTLPHASPLPSAAFPEAEEATIQTGSRSSVQSDCPGCGMVPDAAQSFRQRQAIEAMRTAQSASVGSGWAGNASASRRGQRLERPEGHGQAIAGGTGPGDAEAETGAGSVGCASAVAEGRALSRASVAEDAYGSASAWSGYLGPARAFVDRGATGDASATAKGAGEAHAEVGAGAAGKATARSLSTGSATAAAFASGDLRVEAQAAGSIRVEHRGEGDLEVVHGGPMALALVCHYPGSMLLQLTEDGALHCCENGRNERLPLPSDIRQIMIRENGTKVLSSEPELVRQKEE